MKNRKKAKISPESFTLPFPTPYRLGKGIEIRQLMENLRHMENALRHLGVTQCRNCAQINPGPCIGIGGICEDCWIHDENIGEVDFSAIPDHEVIRHLRSIKMFCDMERRDRAILKESPGHQFAWNRDFMLRESYLGIFSQFDHEEKFGWSQDKGVHRKD